MTLWKSAVGFLLIPVWIVIAPLLIVGMVVYYFGAMSYDGFEGLLKTLGLMEVDEWESR